MPEEEMRGMRAPAGGAEGADGEFEALVEQLTEALVPTLRQIVAEAIQQMLEGGGGGQGGGEAAEQME